MRLRNAIVTFAKKECTAVPALSSSWPSSTSACLMVHLAPEEEEEEEAWATRPLRILGHKRDRMSPLPGHFHTRGEWRGALVGREGLTNHRLKNS